MAKTITDARETLKQIEGDLRTERDALSEALVERDAARDAFAESGNLSRESEEYKAAETAVAKVGQHRDRIAELQEMQVTTLKLLGQETPGDSGHDRPAGDGSDPRSDGWNAAALLADEDLRTRLAHMAATKAKIGPVELGQVASRDAMVADVTGTTAMRRGDYLGVIPQLRRKLRVLDLIPTGTMDNNQIPYTQESGSFTTAAETTEGSAKGEGAITLTDATADAVTIAHWLKIRKQALADFPALQSIIDSRLRYGVLRRLEAQILSGDGSAPNLRGILNTSGIGTVTFSAGANLGDQLLHGFTTVFLADAEATGVVLHPSDWETILKSKASGSGEYFSGGPFEVTPLQVWGVPCVPSASITQGTALVGDFEIGAMLLIREGVNVLLSDSDQDDFIRNRVTLLGEMRTALPVFRPPAFCSVALQ